MTPELREAARKLLAKVEPYRPKSERLRLAEAACGQGRALIDYATHTGGYLIASDLEDLTKSLSAHWDFVKQGATR